MCGLFGVMGSDLYKGDIESLNILAILSQFRGTHSTGVCVADYNKKEKKRTYNILKKAIPSYHFVETDSYKKLMSGLSTGQLVIGHCRHATLGEINEANAHPFNIENSIIGVHNGTMPTFAPPKKDEDTRTDSLNFYEELFIKDSSFYNVFPSLTDRDAYAFVWVDVQDNTLHMVRNNQRPLYVMVHKPHKSSLVGPRIMYWASELAMLKFMAARSNLEFEPITLLETETEYVWEVGDLGSLQEFEMHHPVLSQVTEHQVVVKQMSEASRRMISQTVEVESREPREGQKSAVPLIETGHRSLDLIPFEPDVNDRKSGAKVNEPVKKDSLVLPAILDNDTGVRYYKATNLVPNRKASESLPKFITYNRERYILRYRGWKNHIIPIDKAVTLLKNGNLDSHWQRFGLHDSVIWVEKEGFIPDHQMTDNFYKNTFTPDSMFRGELIYVHEQDYQNHMANMRRAN